MESKILTNVAAFIGPLIIKAIYTTLRIERIGEEHLSPCYDGSEKRLMAFWHNRLLMMAYGYRGDLLPYVLISQHGDGEIIARILRRFDSDSVRGSTTRGAIGGMKAMLRKIREGSPMSITPDGPRGPKYVVQPGVIALAKMAGIPIVPMIFSVSRKWELNSWDRFQIPKPFARGIFYYGEPFHIPSDLKREDFETYRKKLEDYMQALTEKADRIVMERGF